MTLVAVKLSLVTPSGRAITLGISQNSDMMLHYNHLSPLLSVMSNLHDAN